MTCETVSIGGSSRLNKTTRLDSLGGNGLLNQGAQNLRALLVVEVAKEKVPANGLLQAIYLFCCFRVYGRCPVVVRVGDRFERLGRDRCAPAKVVLSRVALGVWWASQAR